MTDGQFKYKILRKLQVHWSCSSDYMRAYLYNFFGELFDNPSVIVDAASYIKFMELMDYEVDYAAKKNLSTPAQLYEDEQFNDSYVMLQDAFSSIGIELSITYNSDGDPTSLVFNLPSGEVKTLSSLSTLYTSVRLHAKLGVTEDYYAAMEPFYNLDNRIVHDLHEIGTNSAGGNLRWTYDADSYTLEITGTGALVQNKLWKELGITDIRTIILGAGVNTLNVSSLDFKQLTLVDLHGEEDLINFLSGGAILLSQFYGSSLTERNWVIYSDNRMLREFSYGSKMSIEWHPLSDWLSGNDGESATNYLYNGIELQDINTVWTDKEAYPYASLQRGDYTADVYLLHVSNEKLVFNGTCLKCDKPIKRSVFMITTDEEIATESGAELNVWFPLVEDIEQEKVQLGEVAIALWSNFDILNEDGTVYLAASEPAHVQ